MTRKLSTLFALALLVLAPATPAGGDVATTALQTPEPTAPPAPVPLGPGEVYAGAGFEMAAAGLVVAASPDAPGMSEVRVAVSFRNTAGFNLPSWTPGIDDLGFPEVLLRDDRGGVHRVDVVRPIVGALPGADVPEIAPGNSVRWTLGFQVPSEDAASLDLLVTDGIQPLAQWSLAADGVGIRLAGPSLPVVRLDQSIEYDAGVEVIPRATGSLICGEPDYETVAHLFTVTFDVHNANRTEVRWPADVHRGPTPVAQWADGASAAMGLETYWGDAETLPHVGGHAVLMPPATRALRAMVFAAPRDGRFSDLSSLPAGLRLPTASGDVWLDLEGVAPSVGLDPRWCDLGGLGAPIPYAFSPGPVFDVGGEQVPPSAAAQDAAARLLLTRARAGATLYYDANNLTLARFDEDDFLAVAPTLDIVAIDAGDDNPFGIVDTVYFDTASGRARFLFVATRSGSGTWFCSGGDLFATPTQGSGPTLAAAGEACYPEAFADADG